MDFKDLPDIATKTTQALTELWDIIGVSQLDRQKKLDNIVEQIKLVYTQAVGTEENELNQMKHEIARCIDRIETIRSQLNQRGTYARQTGTLSEQLARYSSDLELHEEMYEKRTRVFREKLEELHSIWNQLGVEHKDEFKTIGNTINDGRLTEITVEIETAEALVAERKAEIHSLVEVYRELAKELQIVNEQHIYSQPPMVFENCTTDVAFTLPRFELTERRVYLLECDENIVGVHKDTVTELQNYIAELTNIRNMRIAYLNNIATQIKNLWARLSVSEAMQQQWISKNSHGTAIASLRACMSELNTLINEKKQRMGDIIAHAKMELAELWDKAGANETDRQQCAAYYSDLINDDIFNELENNIDIWRCRIDSMEPLFILIDKKNSFTHIRERLVELETDPNRFKKPMLLREAEKIRTSLKAKRPHVINELYQSILAWEQEYGPFCPNGERYLEVLMREDGDCLNNDKPSRRTISHNVLSDANSRSNMDANSRRTTDRETTKRPGTASTMNAQTAKRPASGRTTTTTSTTFGTRSRLTTQRR